MKKENIDLNFINTLMHLDSTPILLYGIGNVGRSDDGLAIHLIEKIEKCQSQNKTVQGLNSSSLLNRIHVYSNYQINIEDALLISKYNLIVFADATKENLNQPFQMTQLKPQLHFEFSTHTLSFESLLTLCQNLYQQTPQAFLLKMKGFDWTINDQLSEQGKKTLDQTFDWFLYLL